MACINKEEQGKLYQSIGRYISAQEDLNSYSHITHMNDLFDKFIKAGKTPATALSYIQLMPRYIQEYLLRSKKNNLVSDDVLMALSILPKKFELGSLENVAKVLGLTSEKEVEETIEINVDEIVSPKDKTQKIFQAKSNDPNSTTGPDERVDSTTQKVDPKKTWFHGFNRALLNNLTGYDGSTITVKNHTGFKLTAIKMSEIPFEELYDFLKEGDFSEEEIKRRLDIDETVALVITDNDGKILKFNNDYSVNAEGRMVYFQMRDTRFDLLDDNIARGRIQSVKEIANNQDISEDEAMRKVLDGVANLKAIQKGVFENKKIVLDITGGTPGYFPVFEKGKTLSYETAPSTLGQITADMPFFKINYDTLGNKANRYITLFGSTINLFTRKLNDTELKDFSKASVDSIYTSDNINVAFEFLAQHLALSSSYKNDLEKLLESFVNNGSKEENTEKLIEFLKTGGTSKTGFWLTYQKEAPSYYGIKNGKLAIVNREEHYNFWKEVLRTPVPLNDDGRVQLFNSYLNFEIDPDTKKELGLEKRAELPSKKPSAIDKIIRNIDPESLMKVKGMSSEASEKQIQAALDWYNSDENEYLRSVVPFKPMFEAMNSNAKAVWSRTGIILYYGSNYTDLYHEAWHGFSQLFLTKKEKNDLYREVGKMSGTFSLPGGGRIKFSDAKPVQIEEYLAEEFRQYKLSNGTKVFGKRPVTNGIFAKILKFLNWLFDNVSYEQTQIDFNSLQKVKLLYDNLSGGKILDKKPNVANIRFGSLASPIGDAKKGNQLTIAQSNEVSDSMDAILSNILENFSKERGRVLIGEFLSSSQSIKNLYTNIKQIIEEKIVDLSTDVIKNEYAISVLQTAIDDFGDINDTIDNKRLNDSTTISYHLRRSKLLDFKTKTLDDNDEKNFSLDTNVQNDLQQNGEVSFEDMANEKVLFLIRTLKQYDSNGEVEMNDLGFPKLTKFNKTLGTLIRNLNNNSGVMSIKRTLEEMSSNGAFEIAELLSKLGNINIGEDVQNKEVLNAWILFANSFNTTSLPLIITRLEQKSDYENLEFGYTLYNTQGKLDLSNTKRKFAQEFAFDRLNTITTKDPSGARVIDKQKLIDRFDDAFGDKYNKASDKAKFNTAVEFYKAIGIPVGKSEEYKELLTNTTVLVGAKFVYKMLLAYTDKGKSTNFIPDHINYLTNTKGENQSNVINTVIESYLKVEDIVSTFSLLNAEGNRQYENILNNTITITKNGINEVNNFVDFYNKPEFAHYNPTRNPMVRHSQMFKKLFGDTLGSRIDTLNLSNFSGIQLDKDGVNVTSVSILDTDPTTKFFIDMYSYINNGYIEVPRHADKKMALAFHTSNNPHFINPLEYLQDVPSADDKFVDIMFGYLTAEHERVQDIRNNTISDLDFFPEFKNQGKEFLIFHDILTTEQKNMLYDMSIEDFANLSKDSELYKSLQQQISSYLTFLTSQNKEVYDEMKYLDQDSIRKLVKPAAGKLKISDTEKADRLVRAYSANAFVSFVESTILFYGDISAYNLLKEEFHKRNSSAGSTGRTFMSDKEIIGGYNELFGNKYASKREYKNYGIDKDGTVRTAVFNDIQVQNDKMIAEYADTFKEKYIKDFTAFGLKGKELADRVEEEVAKSIKKYFADEIKEGDGQGWLTFDAYRMLAKLSNEWSQSQEDLYLKIVEGKEIGIDEVMKYFPPRKYQYYGPIKTDKYHLNALHKFSLMPLIPKVIKGKNLELLHERMMAENIHYATFKSGSKTATRTYTDGKSDNLYSDLSTRTAMPIDAPLLVNEINIKFLRNQVSINDEYKGEVVFSTQMRKLIINELFEKGVPLTPNVERLVKSYLKNIEKYIDFNKQELRDEIELKKDGKFNAESLAKIIKKEMSRRDFPEHLQDAVTKIENGKFAYDLSYALNAEDIESILLSIVNKRIVRRKVNGEPLVQAAVSGFELQRMKGVSKEEAEKYGYDELEFYRKDPVTGKTLPMQVKIALQGQFKKLLYLKHNGKVIGDRESLNLALKDPEWMKENGAMVRLTGVRIPVQGFNSMEMMEVAEFLDESAGNIVVPPTQIVSKSGGDFDIDKLSIFFPNIFLNKDKSVVKLDTVGNAGLENNITQDIINILSAPEIAAALIRPNDTDLVQPLSKEMLKYFAKSYNPKKNFNQDPESMKFIDDLETDPAKKVKTRSVSPTKIFETRYNIYKQFSNSVGKKALGIGAVDNAYNALFNQVGLYLNDTFEHSRTDKKTGKLVYQTRKNRLLLNHNKMASGNISLSNIFNKEGTKISDLINQLINGWVDVAKDPWIAYVMGTPEASPSLLYLVQAGVPFKQAVYFLANPLVREYFDTLKKMKSPLAALSQKLEQNDKLDTIVTSSLPENEFKLKTRMLGLDQYTTGHKLYDEIIDLTKGIENITEKELKDRLEASLDPAWERNETDMAVFAHFLEILDVANGLFKIKSALNFDTKTSTTMYDAYARTVKKDSIIEENEDEANVLKIFPKDKLKALYNDTILKNFDVSEMQMEMFGDMFKVRNHPNLNKYLLNFYKNSLVFGSNIYDRVKEIFNGNDKLISEFKNDFTTAITLTALRDFNPKTGVYKGYQIVDVNSKEYDRVVNKKATKSLPTDKLHFAKKNYTKQTAEDYPKYGFIFTENAEKLGTDYNVSTTQAVIRTNKQGERNSNALAIVTKKMQKAGANFTNSEADFNQFKELNTKLIDNIVNSKFERIIVPTGGFAMEKAQLPTRFAEWLQNELQTKLNIATELVDRGEGVSGLTNSKKYEEPTTQQSASTNEFDVADKLTPIEQNFIDGQGGRQMQSQFKDKSTMDLIISGDRTRTTRAKTDIQRMAKDYSLSKISDLVGKVIRMTDNTGRQVYTRITKVAPFTQEYQDATWEKEGWVKAVTDKNVGNYPYAIEFEVVNKPTQTSEVEQVSTKGTNIPGYIPTGVFVQDGKMYVDMEILAEQFKNGDYSNNNTGAYSILVKTAEDTSYTLTKMSPKTFNNNFSEYVHFVMEREYQRSVLKATDITNFDKILSNIIRTKKEFLLTATNKKLKMDIGENKKINDTVGTFELNKYGLVDFIDASTGEILYENLKKVKGNEYQEYVLNKDVLLALQLKVVEDHITNKALKNILNSYSYMEDPNNGYAIQLMNMLRDPAYSYLKKDYTILDALTTSHSKESGITNLVFKEGKPDADTITNYNDELNRLANIDVIKNDDIHVNKAISEFFEKFQYYVLLSSGFSSNTKYSLNSIISQEKILSFTNNEKIKQATNRILNNADYSIVEKNINTFTEKFLKNRLGLVRAGGTEKFSKKPGFTTDSSNRNKQYVAQGVSEPVTRYENVIPSDNTLKKVNDFLYYIDIDLIRTQASGSKDPKYFTNTLLKLAETHDDKLFIFTSGDKIPVTVKASNISTFNSPEQIKNAEFSGPVIIPMSGLKGMNDAGTALLSEALFEKFNVRNPGFDKGSSKLTIREMMNSDSFLTSVDVINSIRIKSHAILDELNSCNF